MFMKKGRRVDGVSKDGAAPWFKAMVRCCRYRPPMWFRSTAIRYP